MEVRVSKMRVGDKMHENAKVSNEATKIVGGKREREKKGKGKNLEVSGRNVEKGD